MAAKRRATLVADAVSVLCPTCGEPQPNGGDGSEQWTPEDFRREHAGIRNGIMKCVSCEVTFLVVLESKVMFR